MKGYTGTLFFIKNLVYKNVEAHIWWNLKNVLDAQITKSFHLFVRCKIEAQNMKFDIKSLIFGDILTNFVYKLEHIMTILWNSMKIQEHRTF